MQIRRRTHADDEAVAAFLRERHSLRVARLGALLHPLEHPALLTHDAGAVAGVLSR